MTTIEELILENIIPITFGVWLFVLFIAVVRWWRGRGALEVRVKTPLGEKKRYIKPEADGKTLVLEKKRRNNPGWVATFTNKSLVPVSRWFGRKGFAVDLMYQATECVNYDFENKSNEQPKWTKKQSKEFIEAEVLKHAGRGLKYEMPGLFWLIAIGVVILIIFQIIEFISRGGIRF